MFSAHRPCSLYRKSPYIILKPSRCPHTPHIRPLETIPHPRGKSIHRQDCADAKEPRPRSRERRNGGVFQNVSRHRGAGASQTRWGDLVHERYVACRRHSGKLVDCSIPRARACSNIIGFGFWAVLMFANAPGMHGSPVTSCENAYQDLSHSTTTSLIASYPRRPTSCSPHGSFLHRTR